MEKDHVLILRLNAADKTALRELAGPRQMSETVRELIRAAADKTTR